MERQHVIDSLSTVSSSIPMHHDFWFWVAMAELLIIILYIVHIRKTKRRENVTKDLKETVMAEGTIDFNNTMMSAFHAQELYDELKVKYHPDRFPNDDEKNKLATELFQQIVENKNNYNKLLKIRQIAQETLHNK